MTLIGSTVLVSHQAVSFAGIVTRIHEDDGWVRVVTPNGAERDYPASAIISEQTVETDMWGLVKEPEADDWKDLASWSLVAAGSVIGLIIVMLLVADWLGRHGWL